MCTNISICHGERFFIKNFCCVVKRGVGVGIRLHTLAVNVKSPETSLISKTLKHIRLKPESLKTINKDPPDLMMRRNPRTIPFYYEI